MKTSKSLILAATVSLFAGQLLFADLIVVSVDFNAVVSGTPTPTYAGSYSPPSGGLGGVWNGLNILRGQNSTAAGTTYSALVDSEGNATPYSLTIGTSGNYGSWSYAHTPGNDLVNDYLYELDPLSFTVSGFDPAKTYDLTFHMYGNASTTWTLDGTTQSGNNTTRYSVWEDIQISGTTSFTGTIVVANEFNGFQLVITEVVPEPGTGLLVVLGLLTLRWTRRQFVDKHLDSYPRLGT